MDDVSTRTRIGDGLALGDDLLVAARQAVASALAPLNGARPDLACVFVSGGTPESTEAALLSAAALTGARTTVGCGAHGVMAAGKGIEATGGVSVWVAVLPSVTVRAFHLEVLRNDDTVAVLGMPQRRDDDVVGLLLADPWSFPADGFVEGAETPLGHLPLVGGLASNAGGPGGTRLLIDGQVRARGAVGVVLGGDLAVHTFVSQGCRPIGLPMTVTATDRDALVGLAGRSAFEQAKAAINSLPEDEQVRAVRGLTLGVAVDEYAEAHTEFEVHEIVGADHLSGAISIGTEVSVGRTVQFLLRDATAAHSDLADVLGAFRRSVPMGGLAGALVFSCNSRGRSMFPTPDHDVTAVRGALGLENVAGFFTAGEIGPRGGRNRVHGHAATVLAFGA
jgi:small ligand-binding sensory domain FIST